MRAWVALNEGMGRLNLSQNISKFNEKLEVLPSLSKLCLNFVPVLFSIMPGNILFLSLFHLKLAFYFFYGEKQLGAWGPADSLIIRQFWSEVYGPGQPDPARLYL